MTCRHILTSYLWCWKCWQNHLLSCWQLAGHSNLCGRCKVVKRRQRIATCPNHSLSVGMPSGGFTRGDLARKSTCARVYTWNGREGGGAFSSVGEDLSSRLVSASESERLSTDASSVLDVSAESALATSASVAAMVVWVQRQNVSSGCAAMRVVETQAQAGSERQTRGVPLGTNAACAPALISCTSAGDAHSLRIPVQPACDVRAYSQTFYSEAESPRPLPPGDPCKPR